MKAGFRIAPCNGWGERRLEDQKGTYEEGDWTGTKSVSQGLCRPIYPTEGSKRTRKNPPSLLRQGLQLLPRGTISSRSRTTVTQQHQQGIRKRNKRGNKKRTALEPPSPPPPLPFSYRGLRNTARPWILPQPYTTPILRSTAVAATREPRNVASTHVLRFSSAGTLLHVPSRRRVPRRPSPLAASRQSSPLSSPPTAPCSRAQTRTRTACTRRPRRPAKKEKAKTRSDILASCRLVPTGGEGRRAGHVPPGLCDPVSSYLILVLSLSPKKFVLLFCIGLETGREQTEAPPKKRTPKP